MNPPERERPPEGGRPDSTAATAINPQGSAAATRARALEGLLAIVAQDTEWVAAELDRQWGPIDQEELWGILVEDHHRYLSGRIWDALHVGLHRYLARREVAR